LLSWITGELSPSEEVKATQSWVPEFDGEFYVGTYIRESLETPIPLAIMALAQVVVSDELEPIPFDFMISVDFKSLEIRAGEVGKLLVTVQPVAGTPETVELRLDNIPSGFNSVAGKEGLNHTPLILCLLK